jgi:acetoin utilization protein AcuB
MTANPYTTAPEASLVDAARLMRNLGIGALPVLDRGFLVGIITESDIFDAVVELLGASRAGTRLIVPLPGVVGVTKVLQALAPTGTPVTGLTTITDHGRPAVIVTADERDPRDLVRALIDAGFNPTLISVQDAAA